MLEFSTVLSTPVYVRHAFNASKLLAWRKEQHPACKKLSDAVLAWLIELRFYVPLDTKYVISETFFLVNLSASTEETKPNTTKAHIHKYAITQNSPKQLNLTHKL